MLGLGHSWRNLEQFSGVPSGPEFFAQVFRLFFLVILILFHGRLTTAQPVLHSTALWLGVVGLTPYPARNPLCTPLDGRAGPCLLSLSPA